jgi:outer membrane protein OmpA-like peptidoglycan-associated protein
MRKLRSISHGDMEMFGPGTDLIVSLVAVLMIMFAAQDIINFKIVRQNQEKLMEEIAAFHNTSPQPIGEDKYVIYTEPKKKRENRGKILIQNDATLQRISFEGDILFGSAETWLKERGKAILADFARVFERKKKLRIIKEIQIQGHADIRKYKDGNLQLAANRAIAVYEYLQKKGIHPYEYVMSATSFGEYMPVERKYGDINYSRFKLWKHNDSYDRQELNRRIEIVLIYRKEY